MSACVCCTSPVVDPRTPSAASRLCVGHWLGWLAGDERLRFGLMGPALEAFRARVGGVAP
jgi:hypothetical protein